MKWTREIPKQAGWWWVKRAEGKSTSQIVRIIAIGGRLAYENDDDGEYVVVGGLHSLWRDCFWAGPIPEPEPEDPKRFLT